MAKLIWAKTWPTMARATRDLMSRNDRIGSDAPDSSNSLQVRLLTKPGQQQLVKMLFVMLVRTQENSDEGISRQPGIAPRLQQIFFRDGFCQIQAPQKSHSPITLHARPGLFAVGGVNPGICLIRTIVRLWVEIRRPPRKFWLLIVQSGFQPRDGNLLPGS